MTDKFYLTPEWRALRSRVINRYGRKCMKCGSIDAEIHADHIIPRSVDPSLELDINNIQVLCRVCNLSKSNTYFEDYRGSDVPAKLTEKQAPRRHEKQRKRNMSKCKQFFEAIKILRRFYTDNSSSFYDLTVRVAKDLCEKAPDISVFRLYLTECFRNERHPAFKRDVIQYEPPKQQRKGEHKKPFFKTTKRKFFVKKVKQFYRGYTWTTKVQTQLFEDEITFSCGYGKSKSISLRNALIGLTKECKRVLYKFGVQNLGVSYSLKKQQIIVKIRAQ